MQQHRPSGSPPLTPNQVVAHNLRTARELRGLTQEQAAEHLEPFLGERWSVAVFSAAERSVTGKRIRVFDADTVHAFARGFALPLAYFFLPPDGTTPVGLDNASSAPAGPTEQITLAAWTAPAIRERIDELTRELPASERAGLIRAASGDPGLVSENALLAAVVTRLRSEVETLEALAGLGHDDADNA